MSTLFSYKHVMMMMLDVTIRFYYLTWFFYFGPILLKNESHCAGEEKRCQAMHHAFRCLHREKGVHGNPK